MRCKKIAGVLYTVVLSAVMTTTAFARTTTDGYSGHNVYDYENDQSQWVQDQNGWKYYNPAGYTPTTNGAGYYLESTWAAIDGNGDGVAEFYHFNQNGYLDTNTTIWPEDGQGNLSDYFYNHYHAEHYNNRDLEKIDYYKDLMHKFGGESGYTVNGQGQWVVNGVVQTVNQSWKTTFEAGWLPGIYYSKNRAGIKMIQAGIEYSSDSGDIYLTLYGNSDTEILFSGQLIGSGTDNNVYKVTDHYRGISLFVEYDGIEKLTITPHSGSLPIEGYTESDGYEPGDDGEYLYYKEIDGFMS